MKTKKRIGNTIVSETSAIVQYDDVLATARIVPDEDSGPPWKDCDGWKHTLDGFSWEESWTDDGARFPRYRDRVDCVWHGRKYVKIILGNCYLADYDYYHSWGASRQVARELARIQERNCIEQLKEWYTDGWYVFGVIVEFTTEDGTEFSDSLWGCYDDDDGSYCRKDVIPDCVANVCHELEKAGYTVEGQPDYATDLAANRTEAKKWRLNYNLNSFNVKGR